MASGSQNMTTFQAKHLIGDSTNVGWAGALLHSGTDGKDNTMDTWIFADDYGTAAAPWGIKHDQTNNRIVFVGADTEGAWITLDTGDTYILGKIGIGYDPSTSGNTYKLYVNGTGYFSNSLITASGLHAAFIELSYTTPYIDFHFDNSTADNTSRIIETSAGYLQIPGNFGVGGSNTSYKFYVNGTSYLKGDTTIVGNVSFGASNTSNYISIHGLTGDAADTQWANHYFIGNRHWGSTESSELVLFAGNDVGNGDNANTASGPGPDRIRYISGAHLFQTYSSAVSGTFETVCTSSALVNIFEVNTNRLFSYKNFVFNDAEIGIRRAGRSVAWVNGRNSAIVRETSSSGYHACISIKTTNGSWDIGAYDNSSYTDKLIFSYATDANYNSGNNTSSAYTITTGGYFSGSCASATTASQLYVTGSSGTLYLTGVSEYATKNQTQYIYSPCYMSGGSLYAYHINATSGYLKSTANGNTVTIGSQNGGWCHIYNSNTAVPFIFNHTIACAGTLNDTSASLGTTAYPFHRLILGGATNATMTAASTNPRITFQENTGTQPVHLLYCDWDSYRAPAGLKVIGGASATPAWFEVEGNIYADRDLVITSNIYHPSTDMRIYCNNSGAYFNFQVYSGNTGQKLYGSLGSKCVFEGVLGSPSSREYKHEINLLTSKGTIIDQLQPISFKYNDDKTNEIHFGLIYEDVLSLIPEICNDDGHSKTLNYVELIPLLIKEIQNLRKRVKILESN